jgi:parallel beta-helix repeat protein
LLADLGGRMDIIRSEVAYLGWSAGEPSGISWRRRGTESDPRTGATGSIKNSDLHDNYFGQYSYEAYGLSVLNNQFHNNVVYGFDPHDFSQGFEVAYNKVYDNGKHGIIFSRGCTLNNIHDNEVYGNGEHGIMLDRGSNVNQISNNLVYNNQDGIAIFQSEKNLIQNNTLHDNQRGVRINATFDPSDVFDGLSVENTVLNNTIQNNLQYGIYLYERADKNTIKGNAITGNISAGVYVKTGGNLIEQNIISGNGDGISIVGTDPATPGGIPPSYDPGD